MYRYLCAGSYKSLIKKGRGTWTGEALATASIKQGIGATSIMRGMIDKSGAKLIYKKLLKHF